MNILTFEALKKITNQLRPEAILHPASAAYVSMLVKPYADVLETASIEGMQQWLPLAFPGKLAEGATAALNKAVTDKITTYNEAAKEAKGVELLEEEQYNTTVPEVITAGKEAIIHYLAAKVLELAGNVARDNNDDNIYPWDVQLAIGNDPELSKMLGVTKDMNKLPVDVVIGPQKFTHELTHDFAEGLSLFEAKSVGNRDFGMTMFDVPLNLSGFDNADELGSVGRFVFDDTQTYSVVVAEFKPGFNTPDFMQGFATGAMWAGVDHHTYWKDLTKYNRAGPAVVEEKLTF